MAQGIMTGIGFLGADVIFKAGLRGLTTAASIWITAALGILYGVGFFYPAILEQQRRRVRLPYGDQDRRPAKHAEAGQKAPYYAGHPRVPHLADRRLANCMLLPLSGNFAGQ
jgi:MgtC family